MTGVPAREAITGIVLAGGLGRRMGADADGDDKGLRPFRGRPMAAHVIERLAPQVGALAINANRNADAWRAFGLPVFADRIEGFAGPLAGLHAAMAHATTPWLVTAPCDSPFLPPDLVERLAYGLARAGARIAIARTGGQSQPVFALVDRTLREHLGAFLATGRRRIDAWYAPLPVVEVPFDDEAAFRNINTADELARWERDDAAGTAPGAPR
ncbi:MAG: molybdenum cofactor guanylyltransferase MobA [Burkholderiales bacterium]|jgi:molybdopterin-guanine dinucleotide biosynthesis protein A|nr:molybdenum cofactor guanylyltransferase [Burkholderiales bacterium]